MSSAKGLLLALPWLILASLGQPAASEGGESCAAADGDAGEAEVTMLQRSFGLKEHEEKTLRLKGAELLSGGHASCPCIGISGRYGEVMFNLSTGPAAFPIDAGSSCQNWDFGNNPSCRGDADNNPDWCYTKWCFVDPCNCNLPGYSDATASTYIANSRFQNHRVYYSYETCGYKDTWTPHHNRDACNVRMTEGACTSTPGCAWAGDRPPHVESGLAQACVGEELMASSPVCEYTPLGFNERVWGDEQCKCIGMSDLEGYLLVYNLSAQPQYTYSASTGAYCSAWDKNHDDACTDPDWAWSCTPWCHVDICECGAGYANVEDWDEGEPAAKYLGSQVYFSYATCGDQRYYNEGACPTFTDEALCRAESSRCSWIRKRSGKMGCIDHRLVSACER